MSKTKKSFRNDDFDDEDEVGVTMYSEKHQRYANRIIEQALKSKDIDAFIEDEELDEFLGGEKELDEEGFISCVECAKVLITEEDFKGSMQFYDESNDSTEYLCAHCLKNDQDN